ncbi:MAG: sarcosine oxidase, gamma subunit family protein [Gammaproteobacteria bacterium]|nr:sarcosine oxidase, gamma subunit family protein [Gammaproteobacteria bacterium]
MSEPPGVVCRECPDRAFASVRGDAANPRLGHAVARVAGVDLPREPGTWNHADRSRAYWLGPDEWLLVVDGDDGLDVEGRLRDALDGRFSVADVTGAQVQLELSGPYVGKVLQKSSPYDFDPRNFGPGSCAQTVFAKSTALVAARQDGAFEVVFRRSYADYLMRWLADAAAEYGCRRKSTRSPMVDSI